MDFSYSEDQRLLQDSVGKFLEAEYSFEERRKLAGSDQGYSDDHWRQFADLGLLGLPFDEADGGFGFGAEGIVLVLEAFGKSLVVEPYWSTIVMGGGFLRQDSNATRRADLIGKVIAGELHLASAYAEAGSRYNLSSVATKAEAAGGGYKLSGTKSVVYHAQSAGLLIVSARTAGDEHDAEGITIFLVDPKASGVSIQGYRTVDGLRAAEVSLDGVEVDGDAVLGEVGKGLSILEHAAVWGVLGLGAEASGVMEYTYKTTVEYTRERKQFGVPISSFQVLQHRMVDMFIETEQTKSLVLMLALALKEGGGNLGQSAAALKIQVGKAARHIGQQAIQLHGGMGMTDEMPVGHYFKRLTAINQILGDTAHHLKHFYDH